MQPVSVAARCDQELGGGYRADAVAAQQPGGVRADQGGDLRFQLTGFGVRTPVPP